MIYSAPRGATLTFIISQFLFKVNINIFQTTAAYYSRKEVNPVKETIHTKNSFRSADSEQLKKAVTEKISKLINHQVKKAT